MIDQRAQRGDVRGRVRYATRRRPEVVASATGMIQRESQDRRHGSNLRHNLLSLAVVRVNDTQQLCRETSNPRFEQLFEEISSS
jgi:hypothetical protein